MRKLIFGTFFILLGTFTVSNHLLAKLPRKALLLQSSPKMEIQSDTEFKIVKVSDLTSDLIADFQEGKLPDVAVECTEGLEAPFQFLLQGSYLALKGEGGSQKVTTLRTFYVRSIKEGSVLFSTDLKEWKGRTDFFDTAFGIDVEVINDTPSLNFILELEPKN